MSTVPQMCQRTASRLNNVIGGFLDRKGLLDSNLGWEVRESGTGGGFGVFVTRDFDVGDVIFRDFPVIIGPRSVPNSPRICVSCFSKANLHPCSKGCGLDVCCQLCETSPTHLKECKIIRQNLQEPATDFRQDLYENLTPLRSLFLDNSDKEVVLCLIAHDRDQHGHEIDTLTKKLGFQFKEDDEKFLRFVCCAMDANAFEVGLGVGACQVSVRGLYPLGSLANHSCVPNTLHVFNDKHMIVKAAVFIPKDSEIFHSYTKILWGTTTRLYHLHRTKHFICKCLRCKDPTEFGTYMGSFLCKMCRGLVSPVNPYKAMAKWQCQDCKHCTTGRDSGELTSMLASILRNIKNDDFPFMYRFLNGKLKTVVPETNQVAIELKLKIIWILGHKDGYMWTELTLDQLEIKERICNEVLMLLEKLRCGQNKLRGLLLYELFCCKRETINRASVNKQNTMSITEDIRSMLNEAASILKYDDSAPEEIKKFLEGS